MRRMSMHVVLLTSGLLTTGCEPATDRLTDAHAAAIRDSVADALSRFRQHSAASRWDSVAAFYSESPEFRFFESGQLRYRSAAEVRAALEGLTEGMSLSTDYTDTEIRALAPGLAHMSTLFETTLSQGGAVQFSFGGAITMVWKNERNGWRILSGHSSAPVPRGG